jgi:hypothetical protein
MGSRAGVIMCPRKYWWAPRLHEISAPGIGQSAVEGLTSFDCIEAPGTEILAIPDGTNEDDRRHDYNTTLETA